MGVVEHFFSPAGTFDFFCTKFPATFFACSGETSARRSTWTLYNYFVQRAFSLVRTTVVRVEAFFMILRTDGLCANFFYQNGFPGVAEFVRNKTRDMVCAASAPIPTPVPSTTATGRLLSAPSSADKVPPPSSATPPTGAHAVLSLVYDSDSGKATPELFDDGYVGSTLAAAVFLNILLPAGERARAVVSETSSLAAEY